MLWQYAGGMEGDPGDALQNARSDALSFYLSVLKKEPSNARACIEAARCYARNNDLKAAWAYAEKALSIGISEPNDYYFIGYLAEKRGELNTAFEMYGKALEIAPDDKELRLRRAKLYYSSARYNEAIEDCTHLLSLNPNDVEVLELRADAYVELGKRDLAEKDLRAALDREPGNMRVLAKLESLLPKGKGHAKGMIPPYLGSIAGRHAQSFMLKEKPSVKFADVVGLEAVKRELNRRIILPLKDPKLAKEYGIEAGGGIILYGPPGCGKTFIAKAVAGESNASMVGLQISEILNMWLGQSEKRIHRAFEEARANAPSIIFIDEFDLLGAKRADFENLGYRSMTNALLEELDGLSSSNKNLLVLAATNAPWLVDSAFKRHGRFGKQVYVPPPDEKQRAELFRHYLKGRPVEDNIDYAELGRKSEMCTSADIAGICDSAMQEAYEIAATTGNKVKVGMEQLLSTIASWKKSLPEWYEGAKEALSNADMQHLYPELAEDIARYEKKKEGSAAYYR